MKYFKLIFIIFTLFPLSLQAETAEELGLKIAKASYDNGRGFTDMTSDQLMILIDPQGKEVTREISGKTLENLDPNDGDKSITYFKTPKDVQGTVMLSHTHINDDDDQWLYLPALGRVKRISSSNKSGAFMGSEVAFEDFSGTDYRKYSWKYIGEETKNGESFYILESFPIYENSGYSKRISLTDSLNRTRQVDFFDRKGELLKTLYLEDYVLYKDEIWMANTMRVENVQNKNKTIFKWVNRELDIGINKKDFDKSSLMRLVD